MDGAGTIIGFVVIVVGVIAGMFVYFNYVSKMTGSY